MANSMNSPGSNVSISAVRLLEFRVIRGRESGGFCQHYNLQLRCHLENCNCLCLAWMNLICECSCHRSTICCRYTTFKFAANNQARSNDAIDGTFQRSQELIEIFESRMAAGEKCHFNNLNRNWSVFLSFAKLIESIMQNKCTVRIGMAFNALTFFLHIFFSLECVWFFCEFRNWKCCILYDVILREQRLCNRFWFSKCSSHHKICTNQPTPPSPLRTQIIANAIFSL